MKPSREQCRAILTILSWGPRSRAGIAARLNVANNRGLGDALSWMQNNAMVKHDDERRDWKIHPLVIKTGIDKRVDSDCLLEAK